MDYIYEKLNDERFQQFCQALLVRENPRLQCFPVGQPDGGRDAITLHRRRGKRSFAVFQVKFVRNPPTDAHENDLVKWLTDVLKKEAPKVQQLARLGAKSYYLLTNMPGTAHLDVGSIDKVQTILDKLLPIPGQCWWRDDLDRRLDNAWDLKWVYPELMDSKDIFRFILENGLSDERERRTNAIRAYVVKQFEDDLQIRFKQIELQRGLLDLFVDVPITDRNAHSGERLPGRQTEIFANYLLAMSNEGPVRSRSQGPFSNLSWLVEVPEGVNTESIDSMLVDKKARAIGSASFLLSSMAQRGIKTIVLEGAPGQGKSTITQYVCQVHRIRLLEEDRYLKFIPSVHQSSAIRIPLKVDLRDYATWLGNQNPFSPSPGERNETIQGWHKSLEAFLAAHISNSSGGFVFTVADLHAVARLSAILLVLDGFDEVADISRREEIVEEVTAGVKRLRANAASLQLIITSRPAAFANSRGFPQEEFHHFELDSITPGLIEEYANKWIKAYSIPKPEADEVKSILQEKMKLPHLRDLARNPMQLAILLSLIHTRGASLPDKRTALYDIYIDLFFNREAEKSHLVRKHRELLINIHRYLAWILHSETELGNTSGAIASDNLYHLIEQYLSRQERDTTLVSDLLQGTTERVGALVSRVQGTFEFEVQPLREYFAARYLYATAPYSPTGNEKSGNKLDRFRAISRNFYWLNVTRFFAGCFDIGELSALADLLKEMLEDNNFKATSHPKILIAMVLSDWVFEQDIKAQKRIVELILKDENLRYLLPSPVNSNAFNASFSLSEEIGRTELVKRCVQLLSGNCSVEYAHEIIDLLRINLSSNDLQELFFSNFSNAGSRTDWLRYGLRMGAYNPISVAKIEWWLQNETQSRNKLCILFQAGRFDICEATNERCETILNAILNREVTIPQTLEKDSTLLAFVGYIHSVSRLGTLLAYNGTVWIGDDDDLGSEYLIHRNLNTRVQILPVEATKGFPVLQQCFELMQYAKQLESEHSAEHVVNLNKILEKSRNLWGEHWIHYHCACLFSKLSINDASTSVHIDLLDRTQHLLSRASYASHKQNAPDWWKKQFEAASSETELMFVSLALLCFGSLNTLAKLYPNLDAVLRTLTGANWRQLNRSVRELQLTRKIKFEAIPPESSERFVVTLGFCSRLEIVQVLFSKYFSNYMGDDPGVLDFCTLAIVSLLRETPNALTENLDLIARTFAKGSMFSFISRMRSKHISLELAQEIARNPSLYPSSLVALADLCARDAASRNVIKVSTLAKEAKWFS